MGHLSLKHNVNRRAAFLHLHSLYLVSRSSSVGVIHYSSPVAYKLLSQPVLYLVHLHTWPCHFQVRLAFVSKSPLFFLRQSINKSYKIKCDLPLPTT